MEEKHLEELQKTIEQAQNGNWIPAAIVCGFLGIIIILLLAFYKRDRKDSNKRHEDAEKQLAKLTEISEEQKILLAKHGVKIEQLEQRL